eukprot:15476852-Alexandrium_andersonii.AAC.1
MQTSSWGSQQQRRDQQVSIVTGSISGWHSALSWIGADGCDRASSMILLQETKLTYCRARDAQAQSHRLGMRFSP